MKHNTTAAKRRWRSCYTKPKSFHSRCILIPLLTLTLTHAFPLNSANGVGFDVIEASLHRLPTSGRSNSQDFDLAQQMKANPLQSLRSRTPRRDRGYLGIPSVKTVATKDLVTGVQADGYGYNAVVVDERDADSVSSGEGDINQDEEIEHEQNDDIEGGEEDNGEEDDELHHVTDAHSNGSSAVLQGMERFSILSMFNPFMLPSAYFNTYAERFRSGFRLFSETQSVLLLKTLFDVFVHLWKYRFNYIDAYKDVNEITAEKEAGFFSVIDP